MSLIYYRPPITDLGLFGVTLGPYNTSKIQHILVHKQILTKIINCTMNIRILHLSAEHIHNFIAKVYEVHWLPHVNMTVNAAIGITRLTPRPSGFPNLSFYAFSSSQVHWLTRPQPLKGETYEKFLLVKNLSPSKGAFLYHFYEASQNHRSGNPAIIFRTFSRVVD